MTTSKKSSQPCRFSCPSFRADLTIPGMALKVAVRKIPVQTLPIYSTDGISASDQLQSAYTWCLEERTGAESQMTKSMTRIALQGMLIEFKCFLRFMCDQIGFKI